MNHPSPLVSVIVPVYKAEKFLGRCVESILSQADIDLELLLIDDGSPDGSGALADEYAKQDERVHVIHKLNGGVSSARNRGLEEARGTWITFVDADDYLEHGFFEGLDTEDADLRLTEWLSFGDVDAYTEELEEYEARNDEHLRLFLQKHLNTLFLRTPWGKLFRRKLIGDLQFSPTMRLGEDTVFFFDYLCRCHSLRTVKGPCYRYLLRLHDKRYEASPAEITTLLTPLYAAYRRLNITQPEWVKSILLYYYSICRGRNFRTQMYLWFDHEVVCRMRCEAAPAMTRKEKRKWAWKHLLATLRKWTYRT